MKEIKEFVELVELYKNITPYVISKTKEYDALKALVEQDKECEHKKAVFMAKGKAPAWFCGDCGTHLDKNPYIPILQGTKEAVNKGLTLTEFLKKADMDFKGMTNFELIDAISIYLEQH